jgi:hypothetical protein
MQSESSLQVFSRYLRNAINAERQVGKQCLAYADQGDDAGDQAWLRKRSTASSERVRELTNQLPLGELDSDKETALTRFLHGLLHKESDIGPESGDHMSLKLIATLSATLRLRTTYECLAGIAEAAGEVQTAAAARRFEEEENASSAEIRERLKAAAGREFEQLTQ